ncbi:hypothetical protein [Streptomyces sp. NPDC127098]|uniref:hypothetical protein n=1 Tax=Streptomyces sp. NPDC127098 TaxID=3347137 RepID=UPI0036618537
MSPDTAVRRVGHELAGQLVTDPATGRVLQAEAHVRPVDGSGMEWTADASVLEPVVADAQGLR